MAPLAGGSRSDLWGSSFGLQVNLSPALCFSQRLFSARERRLQPHCYLRGIIFAGPEAFTCALLAIMLPDLPHEQGCLLVESMDSWRNSGYTYTDVLQLSMV